MNSAIPAQPSSILQRPSTHQGAASHQEQGSEANSSHVRQAISEGTAENYAHGLPETGPKTSVSSVSAAQGSSKDDNEQTTRPTDEEIIAHENTIRCGLVMGAVLCCAVCAKLAMRRTVGLFYQCGLFSARAVCVPHMWWRTSMPRVYHNHVDTCLHHCNRAAEYESIPLVGDRQPLHALAAEYQAGSQVFVTKIRALEQQYIAVRRTRGDGNCFFRSFLFAYLEPMAAGRSAATRQQYVIVVVGGGGVCVCSVQLYVCLLFWCCCAYCCAAFLLGLQGLSIATSPHILPPHPSLTQRIKASRARLVAAGFQELVFEDNIELFIDILDRMGAPVGPMELPQLEEKIRSPDVSNTLVMLLRFIVSAEVQLREDFFAPFVLVCGWWWW